MKKLSNEEQIAWQKAVIWDEMDELQKQWEKAISQDWRKLNESVRKV